MDEIENSEIDYDGVLYVRCVCDSEHIPAHAHAGDAGADMRAAIDSPLTIYPSKSEWVPLGVRVEIPDGFVGLQFPRSGLGCNHGICLANGTGVIDSGYRGEVKAKLLNLGKKPYTVKPNDRICQLVVVPYMSCVYVPVDELSDTERGTDGYGSTGVE